MASFDFTYSNHRNNDTIVEMLDEFNEGMKKWQTYEKLEYPISIAFGMDSIHLLFFLEKYDIYNNNTFKQIKKRVKESLVEFYKEAEEIYIEDEEFVFRIGCLDNANEELVYDDEIPVVEIWTEPIDKFYYAQACEKGDYFFENYGE